MEEKWRDWPVVYLINNSKSIYIWEIKKSNEYKWKEFLA